MRKVKRYTSKLPICSPNISSAMKKEKLCRQFGLVQRIDVNIKEECELLTSPQCPSQRLYIWFPVDD